MDRRQLGKYDVLCRLSTGGMSEIYLAVQGGVGGFNKLVVLKTILPDIGGEEDFVRMFLDEARITAAFNHPNIAHVYELDTADATLFMAMEFVQGCTLVEMARACRQAKEPIPIGLTLASVRDTALALHYAHTFVDARGRRQVVIHRDVAEKNIMVTYEGVTKLLDFGIAKALGRSGHTSVGMVKGTSGYMSPEQIRGEPLDARSDIFSLGVVLHECLTGLRLFHGKNPEEGMKAALHTGVAPPSKWNKEVRPELDAIVLKALQRDREARFSTALEFARAIEKVGGGNIWHPEQVGELVVRHFAERRAETRRVLEDAFGGEATGEIRVASLIARMKSDRKSGPLPVQPQVTAANPNPVPGGNTTTTLPSYQQAGGTLETNPARPRSLKPSVSAPVPAARSTPPVPAPKPLTAELSPRPPPSDFDDESEAKTIPAAALPPEIKELRKRLQLDAARRRAEANDDERTIPVQVSGLNLAGEQPTSLKGLFANQNDAPTPAVQPPSPVAPQPQASAPARPRRTVSGETLSVTNRGEPQWAPESTTTDETPSARPPKPQNGSPTQTSQDDFVSTSSVETGANDEFAAAARPRRGGLIAVLVILLLLGFFGVLALLDILPVSFSRARSVEEPIPARQLLP